MRIDFEIQAGQIENSAAAGGNDQMFVLHKNLIIFSKSSLYRTDPALAVTVFVIAGDAEYTAAAFQLRECFQQIACRQSFAAAVDQITAQQYALNSAAPVDRLDRFLPKLTPLCIIVYICNQSYDRAVQLRSNFFMAESVFCYPQLLRFNAQSVISGKQHHRQRNQYCIIALQEQPEPADEI